MITTIYTHAENGRIWLTWKAAEVEVIVQKIHHRFIHCTVADTRTYFACTNTIVYGSNNMEEKREL